MEIYKTGESMPETLFHNPDRRKSDSVKWNLYGDKVLPLWVADMDFTSPPEVIDALHERVRHGVFGYAAESRILAELVVDRMQRFYAWKIEKEDVLLLPGVISGFNLVCQAVTQPGESMIIQPPIYPPFFETAKNARINEIRCGLVQQNDGAYQVDFTAFENALQPDTKCFLFCNPHNPVGKVYSKEELSRLAEICLARQVIICADEIHSDLVFTGHEHVPIASLDKEIGNQVVTLIAPSKTFNIAGLDCAILICENKELMEQIKAAKRGILGGVNILGVTAGVAAYKYGQPWLDAMLKTLEENRNYLCRYVQENLPMIKVYPPQATYLAWLDCRQAGLPDEPYEFFLKIAKVALNCGINFGKEGEGFVRLNFGCSKSVLQEALERMRQSMA
jgi:cystathionine beta-lyase